jgi:hypothetical protein
MVALSATSTHTHVLSLCELPDSGRVVCLRQAGAWTHLRRCLVLGFVPRDVSVDNDDHGITCFLIRAGIRLGDPTLRQMELQPPSVTSGTRKLERALPPFGAVAYSSVNYSQAVQNE